jgi:hypothetical protein
MEHMGISRERDCGPGPDESIACAELGDLGLHLVLQRRNARELPIRAASPLRSSTTSALMERLCSVARMRHDGNHRPEPTR